MVSHVRMDVKEVVRHFKHLEDPRSSVNLLHPLDSVVVIAIMGVLAGANGPTAIRASIVLPRLRVTDEAPGWAIDRVAEKFRERVEHRSTGHPTQWGARSSGVNPRDR